MKIYNTLTRQYEEFVSLKPNHVDMYVCGPTVYNYIHLGNARSLISFDTIRRYFEYQNYTVNFILNFTDIDDKIIKQSIQENISIKELTDKYIKAFHEDTKQLCIKPATKNPKVTEYIPQIIDFIQELIKKGYAYVTSDGVYFSIEKYEKYGQLANKNIDQLIAGASKRTEDTDKQNPLDFALWKFAEDKPFWTSPWGHGRPGWHIECSVMSTEILGATIDIHGGGADLEFPHHTNEIAQSEAKTGQTFANYWMHNGFVNIDDVKMSKSLGNFITVHDALKTIDGQVLRFLFATQHYRKPINFTEKAVHDAATNLKYLKHTYEQPFTGQADSTQLQVFLYKFTAAMDEDFNTANSITVVFELAKWINSGNYTAEVKEAFAKLLEVFGIIFVEEVLDANIERLIEEHQIARDNRDFVTADRIREQLLEYNLILEDTKTGTRFIRKR